MTDWTTKDSAEQGFDDDEERGSLPWMTTSFDLESLVAAGAALLVTFLLFWLWEPLGFIGLGAVVLALLAGRKARRAPPDFADGILAPCDGVIVSVVEGDTPLEIRMDEHRVTRVRIASAPSTTIMLYSPINGGVEHLQLEAGDPSVPFATSPEEQGLATANVVLESRGQQVGMRFVTGGLGPRMQFDAGVGDVVRIGRSFGKRRLGGWCDLYMPSGAAATVWPGQTIIGGETMMGRFLPEDDKPDYQDAEVEEIFEADEETAPEPEPEDEAARLFDPELEDDDYPSPEDADVSDDPAVIFARIREAARKHGESD